MRLNILHNLEQVAQHQLCAGCGACAAIDPDRIEMIDVHEHGRRPRYLEAAPTDDRDSAAMRACPGVGLEHTFDRHDPKYIEELVAGWGPVLAVYEGWASDPMIRHHSSSGGAVSALSLTAIEADGAFGVLHTAARMDAPLLNETVMSTSRAELLAASGSRYAPASPADGLRHIAAAPDPCVFVGKPCDVAAVQTARREWPELDQNLHTTIGIFCAGTPTTRATLNLLQKLGVKKPEDVTSVRYRGRGWPGRFTATVSTPLGDETRSIPYADAWGELTNDKAWRCHVCPDHTGEFADLSVGDPWHTPPKPGEPGRSLIVVRTERGAALLARAIEHGALTVEAQPASVLPAAQPNLLRGRGAVWARRLACRIAGVPVPSYRGFPMARFWWSELRPMERLRSIAGTFRRIRRRQLGQPVTLAPSSPIRAHRHPFRFTTPAVTRRRAA